jgi:hypothetical protein
LGSLCPDFRVPCFFFGNIELKLCKQKHLQYKTIRRFQHFIFSKVEYPILPNPAIFIILLVA